MHPTLSIAVKAARRAGAVITRASRDIEGLTVSRKSHNDFVTEVDKAAEEAIIGILSLAFPDHAILAEESGLKGAPDAELATPRSARLSPAAATLTRICSSVGVGRAIS